MPKLFLRRTIQPTYDARCHLADGLYWQLPLLMTRGFASEATPHLLQRNSEKRIHFLEVYTGLAGGYISPQFFDGFPNVLHDLKPGQ